MSDDYPQSSTDQYPYSTDHFPAPIHHSNPEGLPAMDEEWEEEADRLYEWTQELSFDELVATPRLPTAQTQYA